MNTLIEKTKTYLKNAYVPYSDFRVAACVKTKTKEYYGANIENASYGLSNCAERSALFAAYSQGVRKEDIEAMIIVTKAKQLTYPCGACRQVMVELVPREAKVILANEHEIKETTVEELIPFAFDASDLDEE
ncbi:cytidine deaminase [Breznakia sp. PF5-3]|uniref:cytidine deaminase n=1 Tax=unclassified Breznakia TaxID=2623764 RepID=UPI0024077321|nr:MULTISPECIES: cytidine deaminase [unclassified Breznakia]MDF9825658.1 cytidine deaminase [Breznakia sp. PM6-1]MDF9836502.1 cytidine deaminase [Breznakia sp. PF5-3]MDF9838647.1 cytidine deaminase [Breznakia sp. PFB2-8]MDF9860678.1 cytidine deaminase [Breznakia sp. PH5-24]